MRHDFRRVAVVNRGEPAMRFIRAAREFNQEYGTAIQIIALFTEPERHAMFVREADDAISLGAAQVTDAATGQYKSSYVDYGRLGRALALSRAEAVWVGWGFVAEHADFADLCRELGIVFIGPDGDVMRQLGDKITSKRIAEQAGIPVAPWSGGPVETFAEARRHAETLGYPLLVKATAGGGGHGIRRVQSAEQLERAFDSARADAFKAFGNATVFMERLMEHARHVEVQIIADRFGTTWAAGVRDCTIQRRHQKILEEAPSPALSAEEDAALRRAAVALSQAVGYSNAGTVEFLYQPESQRFFFLEMNTRLQVEHPVTECTTGLDMVKLQIHVARGGILHGEPPRATGHAVEVRLNAEDPENGFSPAPGTVERFRMLTGPGVRIDAGVAEGDVIPAEFDSMIAKIIAHGKTREEALSRLQRTLRESVVVISGGTSNKSFLQHLLTRAEVRSGHFDTGWLDRLAAAGEHVSRHNAAAALMQAAIEVYEAEAAAEQSQFYASALRGRPQLRSEIGRSVRLSHHGQTYVLNTCRVGPAQYHIDADTGTIEAEVDRLGKFEYWLNVFGQRFHTVAVREATSYRIEVNGCAHRIDCEDGGVVRAPAPAVVIAITVQAGDMVNAGETVAILEAMKMEMPVLAPLSGKVRQIMAIPYVQVDTGAPLLRIESEAAGGGVRADGERVVLAAQPRNQSGCRDSLIKVRNLLLGYDIDAARTSRVLAEWRGAEASTKETERLCCDVLNIFVDLCSLFHRHPKLTDAVSGEEPSAESHLFAYLRTLDARGQELPAEFVDALRRAVSHYGLRTLDRSAELEQSLLLIYKSHQRLEQQASAIQAILERYLARIDDPEMHIDESFDALLDRLVTVTTGRFPALSDLAREVRYRCFDQKVFEAARQEVYRRAGNALDHLALEPDGAGAEAINELVECPQPLAAVFMRRLRTAGPEFAHLMLQVLTTRYYRVQDVENIRRVPASGYSFVAGEYLADGRRIHVFAGAAEYERLAEAIGAMTSAVKTAPADRDVVMDLFVWSSCDPPNGGAVQREITAALGESSFDRAISRIVVVLAGPTGPLQYFTYRQAAGGFEEDPFYRGLHPMIGARLHLWRLENFKVERLPSAEDVYLLHGVARDNPKDERLFACAEVRDLTPVRDESGRIVQLPHLERMFTEALAGIRLFQSRRPWQQRLYWNRILLYVWPALTLNADELRQIVEKLIPATQGLGLEQVVVRARIPNPASGELRDTLVRISTPAGAGLLMTFRPATWLQPLKPLTEYAQKVVRMRQRGLTYPYEIIKLLTPAQDDAQSEMPAGDFVEYDLDGDGRLLPVERPYGGNTANIIAGVIRNFTPKFPEGMTRVALWGDPSKDLGAIAEPECRRIIAALNLAEEMRVPVEWFAVSAGAKISMESGVENMDWIARVLRRLIEFTQAGGEVNLVVDGINVGAQPYWNAEATMLMHTRGILIMTPKGAMVLTGKRALDYSGSVSAEDNQGIGGYDRIMGFNGQAQYWARDVNHACHILLRHYEHTYVAPGERFARPAVTHDAFDRDVTVYPHNGGENGFARVGDIFSDETNPGRKKSFDIRRVMKAVLDQDHAPLERWAGMRAAETAVVWDAHLGGYPVCLIGIESRPVARLGFVPADGPEQWTAGTLFPLSSKKVARAINAASNNRPVVLLANLSGFDGSPESMRKLQLEYGAEIGRAVVNFKGPMVFCVISRYHGGAYVVFSRALNEHLEVAALEGTYASVIGGAPAAAVVFAGEVEARARKDPRLQALTEEIAKADGAAKVHLRGRWNELFKAVHAEKLAETADEFDGVHSVHRALKVGALHFIIPPAQLRPYLIDAVERGLRRQLHDAHPAEHGADKLVGRWVWRAAKSAAASGGV